MRADIRSPALPISHWLNHILSFQCAVNRRHRGKELAGFVPVNKDMAYRLADKLRCPGSGFNGIAFIHKRLIPGGPGFNRLWICPSAQFPGSNPKNPACAFLGKALTDSFVYGINHSSFYLKFKMAI